MKRAGLKEDYEQLLSDMLLMQYRVESFRRVMQIDNGCHCIQLSLAINRAVDELLDLRCDAMREVESVSPWWKRWWSKWV